MTWQEKMDNVIGEVLGEGYNIKVIDDSHFETYYVDILLSKTETILLLPNHWHKHVRSTILLIIENKIQNALLKVQTTNDTTVS